MEVFSPNLVRLAVILLGITDFLENEFVSKFRSLPVMSSPPSDTVISSTGRKLSSFVERKYSSHHHFFF